MPRGCTVRSGRKGNPRNWAPTMCQAHPQYFFSFNPLCNFEKWVLLLAPSHRRGNRLRRKKPFAHNLTAHKEQSQASGRFFLLPQAASGSSSKVWHTPLKRHMEIISLLREKPNLSPSKHLPHGPRKAVNHLLHKSAPGPPSWA